MTQFLISTVAFIVALALLIAIHEFAHFWVARRLGVKVLKFSVGFGKPLLHWRDKQGTEYQIASVPLGGYVKMLDEREGDVAPEELAYAFNRQKVSVRAAVVAAGPFANLALAVILYWVILMAGVVGARPIVGEVIAASPADLAGLQVGDEIVAIDDVLTSTWEQVSLRLVESVLSGGDVDVAVKNENGQSRRMILKLSGNASLDEPEQLLSTIGIVAMMPQLPAVIDSVQPGEAADQAGLQSSDHILSVDGKAVANWVEWASVVSKNPGARLEVRLQRHGEEQTLFVTPGERQVDGKTTGYVGASAAFTQQLRDRFFTEYRYGPIAAIPVAFAKTWQMSAMTLRMLGKMLIGEVGLKNISGPINIAQYAGQSAVMGIIPFLGFLAVVSISLGVLNLLPIPVLDGGHLFFYLIEVIKGNPLSEYAQSIGQQLGMGVLFLLMGLAFYNDLSRVFG